MQWIQFIEIYMSGCSVSQVYKPYIVVILVVSSATETQSVYACIRSALIHMQNYLTSCEKCSYISLKFCFHTKQSDQFTTKTFMYHQDNNYFR